MSEGVNLGEYNFVRVIEAAELPSGERLLFDIGNKPIALFNIGGKYYAIGDVCTHDDGPLGEGDLDGYEVICPRHGARFDLRDGRATKLPAVRPAPWYPVRVVDGFIEIGLNK